MNLKHLILQLTRPTAFVLLSLICTLGCTNPENADSDVALGAAEEALAENGASDIGTLVITTEGAQLHDSSGVGRILETLQIGDSCQVIAQEHMELIHGDFGYWYRVKHGANMGWVSGKQTSWGNLAIRPRSPMSLGLAMELDSPATSQMAKGTTPEIAWQAFKNNRMLNCDRRRRESGLSNDGSPSCIVSETEGLDFEWWDVTEVGRYHEMHHFGTDTLSALWFTPVVWENQKNGTVGQNTLVGLHGSQWTLLGVIDGYPASHVQLGNDTTIICFIQEVEFNTGGEERVDIWISDVSGQTFRRMQTIQLPSWYMTQETGVKVASLDHLSLSSLDEQIQLNIYGIPSVSGKWIWDSQSQRFKPK